MPLIPKRDLARLKSDCAKKMARWNNRGLAKTFFKSFPAEKIQRPETATDLASSPKIQLPAAPMAFFAAEESGSASEAGLLPTIVTSSLETSTPLSVQAPSPSHPLRRAASASGLPRMKSAALARLFSPQAHLSPMSIETKLNDEFVTFLDDRSPTGGSATNPFPSPSKVTISSPKLPRHRSPAVSALAVHSINRKRNKPLIRQ
jgi:hypothetical protein